MTGMTMVERVGRGMARYNWPHASPADIDEMWDAWEGDARAAIAAMREPTEAMVDTGRDVGPDRPYGAHETRATWSAMIDTALSEGGEG